MKKVLHVVGARPNFMKAAPVALALQQGPCCQVIVHTGQHYDAAMSEVFFRDLGMPTPDYNLEVGSGTHAAQTALIMTRFEEVVVREKPDLVLVYGDVNSTVAAALVCAKLLVRVAHVEAGLRSFDRTMPEEINRVLTDRLADVLFTPSEDGNRNLLQEGVSPSRVHLVGNVMIDSLVRLLPRARRLELPGVNGRYALVTLHRPSNVDSAERLGQLMKVLQGVSRELPVVFPVHPRTRVRLDALGVVAKAGQVLLLEPVGYLEFLALQRDATIVITDSGGVQEETTFLGVPCVTVRPNTERPVTVELGTNVLVGEGMDVLEHAVSQVIHGHAKQATIPPLWDGRAAERIAEVIQRQIVT